MTEEQGSLGRSEEVTRRPEAGLWWSMHGRVVLGVFWDFRVDGSDKAFLACIVSWLASSFAIL